MYTESIYFIVCAHYWLICWYIFSWFFPFFFWYIVVSFLGTNLFICIICNFSMMISGVSWDVIVWESKAGCRCYYWTISIAVFGLVTLFWRRVVGLICKMFDILRDYVPLLYIWVFVSVPLGWISRHVFPFLSSPVVNLTYIWLGEYSQTWWNLRCS